MTTSFPAPLDGRQQPRLRATLFSGDRLFPITVTEITENGFAAEGVSLDGLDEEFLLDMTLPPVGDDAWSPKAPAVAARMAGARLRARAKMSVLAQSPAGTSLCKGLACTFQEMSDGCRSALRGWLARLAGAQRPISKGCGPRPMD